MPKPKITSAMELEMLVQQMGFLPFFSCSIPSFSIEEFTPSRYWFVDGVDGPWEWRMELARRWGRIKSKVKKVFGYIKQAVTYLKVEIVPIAIAVAGVMNAWTNYRRCTGKARDAACYV